MNKVEIVICQAADGETNLNVRSKDETIWLNRQQLAILFNRDVKTIGRHIHNF